MDDSISREEYIKAKNILAGEIKPFYESKLLSEIIKEEFGLEVINFYLKEVENKLQLSLIIKDSYNYNKVFENDERYNRKRDESIIKEFNKIMRDSAMNLKYSTDNIFIKYYNFSAINM